MVLLGEHGADGGRDHGALARPDVGQQIAEDVNPAALPSGCNTLAAAAFSPSCASETTSSTPRSPRRMSARRKASRTALGAITLSASNV
jgi:hypothetical protein